MLSGKKLEPSRKADKVLFDSARKSRASSLIDTEKQRGGEYEKIWGEKL